MVSDMMTAADQREWRRGTEQAQVMQKHDSLEEIMHGHLVALWIRDR